MPAVSLEALVCTLIIDAPGGHNIDTFYILGAYLNLEIPKDKSISMNPRGYFVDIMCQVNLEYKQHVKYENKKRVVSNSSQKDLWFH